MNGAHFECLLLFGTERTHDLGRAANDHGAIGEFLALGHQGTCAHQTALADLRAIEHHGTNADQGIVANGATVQHHLMSHGHVLAHGQGLANIGVQHAAILDVGAAPDADGFGVAAQDGAKPDARVFSQFHITHHLGTVGHPGGFRHAGCDLIEFVNCHRKFRLMRRCLIPRIVRMELRQHCLEVFRLTDPQQKVAAVLAMEPRTHGVLDVHATLQHDGPPGRPLQPVLVHPQEVPRRSPFTLEGHCALVHAITHIEFNAVNLALDAVWRFTGMPDGYYQDWLRVAREEAKHFTLLRNHLLTLSHDYGDFVAHDGLWTLCEATRHDVAARMALVPRTLEARGLDATPIIQAKLRKVGTPHALAAVAILDIILEEEVGHVAIGNHWYHWLCVRNDLDPLAFYNQIAAQHRAPRLKPPFNLPARRLAGFSESELLALPLENSE